LETSIGGSQLGPSPSFFRQRSRGGFREVLRRSRVEAAGRGRISIGSEHMDISRCLCAPTTKIGVWSKSLLGKELSGEQQVPVLYRSVSSIPTAPRSDDSKDGRQGISASLLSNSPRDGSEWREGGRCGQLVLRGPPMEPPSSPCPSNPTLSRCKLSWPTKRPASRFLYRLGRFHADGNETALLRTVAGGHVPLQSCPWNGAIGTLSSILLLLQSADLLEKRGMRHGNHFSARQRNASSSFQRKGAMMPLRKVRRPAVAPVESGPLTASSNLATRFDLSHTRGVFAMTDHRSTTVCSVDLRSTVLPTVLRHRLPRSKSLELVSEAPQRP
jgi:hypothetical protein